VYVIELPTGRSTDSLIAPDPLSVPLAPPEAAAVQELDTIPEGSASVTVAPIALLGPALLTTTVYTTLLPGVYVLDPSVFVMDRSALLA
jgi:hypothetical protein